MTQKKKTAVSSSPSLSSRKSATKKLPTIRSYGPVAFWSDLHHLRNAVVVECDDPNYPVIAVYKFRVRVERERCQARAARLLKRILDKKVDYRRLAQRVPKDFRWDRNYMGNRG